MSRCVLCRASATAEIDGLPVCAACIDSFPVCSKCKRRAPRAWVMRDRPERQYCDRCRSGDACDFCGHPASGALKDGRGICEPCRAELVPSFRLAFALFERVRAAVAAHCGVTVRSNLDFSVVTPHEMAGLVGKVYSPTHAMEKRPIGLFVRTGTERTIYCESLLPKSTLITTCAHELGHAWQSEYCARPVVPLLAEGLSEWIAHRIAMRAKLREEARRTELRKDVYGDGFRLINNLVRKVGMAQMLETVKDRLIRGVAAL